MLFATDENMQLVAWNTGISQESALIPKQLHNVAFVQFFLIRKGKTHNFAPSDLPRITPAKGGGQRLSNRFNLNISFSESFQKWAPRLSSAVTQPERWGKGTAGKARTPTPGSGAKANPLQTLSHFSLHFGRFPRAEFWVGSQEPGGET